MMRDVFVMAAPNGSRKTKGDHPNLPMTIQEITEETIKCRDAGAAIAHLHVRDHKGRHVLDTGLYRELLKELAQRCTGFLIQITTEAVGRYSPQQQKDLVCSIKPEMVSIALREMVPSTNEEKTAQRFYAWASEAEVHVQHILYDAQDVRYYRYLRTRGVIPDKPTGILFVLGRYSDGMVATARELTPMLKASGTMINSWFCCAFGPAEGECIRLAMEQGGHPRVGFENNFLKEDGTVADGTYELVAQTVQSAKALGLNVVDTEAARKLLWHRS